MIGLYGFCNWDEDGLPHVKIGKAEDIDDRMLTHRSTAGGLKEFLRIDTSKSMHSLTMCENKLKHLMENEFGQPTSGSETWQVEPEEVLDLIEKSEFKESLVDLKGEQVTNLLGETMSKKVTAPRCYYTGRPASIHSRNADGSINYEYKWIYRDKKGNWIGKTKVYIHKSIKDFWRDFVHYQKVESGEIDEPSTLFPENEEVEERGVLPI
tara:strand:+ start:984 stop:1613 length:630 start_codon:yes stop_codon:yes gene_type:complete